MTVENWFLKSPQMVHGILPRFEKNLWLTICHVLGIVLSRDHRRCLRRLIAHVECERTHINGMLSVPGVAEHVRIAILKRCAREVDRARQPAPTLGPEQLQEPAAPPRADTPIDWDNPEIYDSDHAYIYESDNPLGG
jgi:hypothetical protein